MMSNHHNNQFSLFSISLLLLLSFTLSADVCHPDDKRALLKIKKAFNNAYVFTTWTHDTDCCEWSLITCAATTYRIVSLALTKDDEVAGHIPDSVGDLPYLENLIFTKLPKLTGPIPHSIFKLKNLEYLWLSHNNLTGPIPDFVGHLKKLTYINLSVNKLTGPIPASLSSLNELGALFLERNQLTGHIPESFGKFKHKPDFYVKLAKNKLSGSLPKSLGAPNFALLDLSRNSFIGDASMLFGKNKDLQTVDLSRNKFSFDLSKVVLPRSLFQVDLSHNMIYGGIPSVLPTLPNLYNFNVSYNRLCGRIPTRGIMKLFNKYDYANNKCLCGSPLPRCK